MNQQPFDTNHEDSGFILPLLGLLLIPIMIFTAIAIDVSSWYSRATELQRTADAAALAGVVWTPEIDKARNEASPVLERNGVQNGVDDMTVSMEYGEDGNTSFKVCVTDGEVSQFFAAVFASPTELTRCSTAQYNAPLQLGSPLNYFGGNFNSLAQEAGYDIENVRPELPDDSSFSGDYCLVRDSYPSGAVVGYWDVDYSDEDNWKFWPSPANTAPSGRPNCNTPAPRVPDAFSGNQCLLRDSTGRNVAYWYRENSGHTFPRGWRYRDKHTSNDHKPDCTYGGVTPTANVASPIPKDKSPNFWAAIESYNYGHANGDAYSNSGAEYRDTGYWYSIDVPEGGVTGSKISLQVFDLAFNSPSGRSPMGDNGSNSNSTVRLQVFKAGALKYDMSDLGSPICTTNWITGTNNTAYNDTWTKICDISPVAAEERYYVQVQSTDENGNGLSGRGVTGYSIRAVAGNQAASCLGHMALNDVECYEPAGSTQPRLAAFGDMEMYNGIDKGQPTQFFLADVLPDYAGKTLVIDLFDPGDGARTSWVSIRGPSTGTTEGEPVPEGDCTVEYREYGSDTWHPVTLSDGPSSGPGAGVYTDTCTVQTSSSSGNAFNDRWLRFKVDLPSDYGEFGSAAWTQCDPDVADPVVTAGSCWWQISYFVGSGSLGDYTTWSARVIGDPVRLTH